MSLLTARDLSRAFGAEDVFTGVSLAIPHQARIALVGPNGIGKTTLLRLLVGLDRPDSGAIHRARALRVGYLPQEATHARSQRAALDQSVWEVCLQAFADLRSTEAELAELEASMADPARVERALARYGPLQESFERDGGYTYPALIERVLNGLGFSPDDRQRTLRQLSGGERTRVLLARLLLEDPDLLVLDEPTNHLDMAAVEWLEGWLEDWPGAALIVSHDRYFLDHTVDSIWELGPSGLETYRGNYSAYLKQRLERRERQDELYRAQQALIQREQEYIRRNIAGQNTRQAQGRRKRLNRLLSEGALEKTEEARRTSIEFQAGGRSGDRVVETRSLVIGHPDEDEALFAVPDLVLTRGACAALIGPNGAGKTTFLRTLLGEVPERAGEARLGASLKIGYFVQAHDDLTPTNTVREELLSVDPDLRPAEARNLLGRYLFSGDDIDKLVEVLSGGERGRLALAKLALQGANLLLLDEPTNHLDLPSQEILQQALLTFPGTILLVSHDRYLIDALATQIWSIALVGGEMTVFEGRYSEFVTARRQAEVEARQSEPQPESRRRRQEVSGSERVRKLELEKVEAEIQALESDMDRVTHEIQASGEDVEKVRRLGERFAALEQALEEALERWERLARAEKPA